MRKRVCLLTGAGGILGRGFCRMHAADYSIAAVYRANPPDLDADRRRFIDPLDPWPAQDETSEDHYLIRADLSDDRELERVIELTLARFGRIDLVIHSAVYSVWAGMDSDALAESFDRQFRINVRIPFMLSNLIARRHWHNCDLENRDRNRNIIHISSLAGVKLFRGLGQSVYAASKAALNHLALHMAEEFRTMSVRVNVLAPNSFPGIVSVEDVVNTIRKVDSGTMTGKILVIDRQKIATES